MHEETLSHEIIHQELAKTSPRQVQTSTPSEQERKEDKYVDTERGVNQYQVQF
jgi:hypothetical protein